MSFSMGSLLAARGPSLGCRRRLRRLVGFGLSCSTTVQVQRRNRELPQLGVLVSIRTGRSFEKAEGRAQRQRMADRSQPRQNVSRPDVRASQPCLPVHVTPMADSYDLHGSCAIINDVEHAVISDANAEAILTVELLDAVRARIVFQFEQLAGDSLVKLD